MDRPKYCKYFQPSVIVTSSLHEVLKQIQSLSYPFFYKVLCKFYDPFYENIINIMPINTATLFVSIISICIYFNSNAVRIVDLNVWILRGSCHFRSSQSWELSENHLEVSIT